MKRVAFLHSVFIAALLIVSGNASAVTPTCPPGYVLSGNQCLLAAPAPSCPLGFVYAQGQCLRSTMPAPIAAPPAGPFYPREVQANLWGLGCLTGDVAIVVNGAWDQRSREALRKFYNVAGIRPRNLEPTQAASDAINNSNGAVSCSSYTAPRPPRSSRSPRSSKTSRSCRPRFKRCMRKAARNTHPRENLEMEQDCKRQLATCSRKKARKRPSAVRKRLRCSKIKFAFSRGNTCRCSGGRIFTGRACVKRRRAKPRNPVRKCTPVSVCNRRYSSCRARIEVEGNQKGWDGDLRRDRHDATCLPQKTRCLAKRC